MQMNTKNRVGMYFGFIALLFACTEDPPPLQPLSSPSNPSITSQIDSGSTSLDGSMPGSTPLDQTVDIPDMTHTSSGTDQFISSSENQDMSINREMPVNQAMPISTPPPPQGYPQFRFPIADQDFSKILTNPVFGVDHDWISGERAQCEDHQGRPFPFCYDDHQGTDYMLAGSFDTMDRDSAVVVAAARGRVIEVDDGNYDRCYADLIQMDISCDGYPMRPNYVILEHEGGWRTLYYHFKKNSIGVRVGDELECGDALGRVGSSGYSSGPHLHFEVQNEFSQVIDPYTGPSSQDFSLWTQETQFLPGLSCAD